MSAQAKKLEIFEKKLPLDVCSPWFTWYFNEFQNAILNHGPLCNFKLILANMRQKILF